MIQAAGNNWAIVLAAGEGTRLLELTTRGGIATPKQYCSLRGGRTLLEDALARAARVVARKRIVVVVAEEHRSFWAREPERIPAENVIVQPRNRGTAAGILLPLLHVIERDPAARVLVLPSDHYVEEEQVLASSLRFGLDSLDEHDGGVTLFGITPDAPETGYGWIVPARSDKLVRAVARFVEKPDARLAAELHSCGGVWNSFLFVARSATLIQLYEQRLGALLERFRSAFAGERELRSARLDALYAALETNDFSRELLQDSEERLSLLPVPPCGWTDLGTPSRVEACLESLAGKPAPLAHRRRRRASFDLSFALERMRGSIAEVRTA